MDGRPTVKTEAPGTAPLTTNSKNLALTRQRILCELSVASVVRNTRVNAVLTDDREQQTDLESHADTCVISQNALIVHNFYCPENVVGYDSSKGTMNPNRRTVLAAATYDCPMAG